MEEEKEGKTSPYQGVGVSTRHNLIVFTHLTPTYRIDILSNVTIREVRRSFTDCTHPYERVFLAFSTTRIVRMLHKIHTWRRSSFFSTVYVRLLLRAPWSLCPVLVLLLLGEGAVAEELDGHIWRGHREKRRLRKWLLGMRSQVISGMVVTGTR